ncbi:peptide-methionine (S)-S-oxide reductase MsrA [Hydromonas duriensis]|uniref:Peptide methionine sulfoxide reductase MsrA n=1 Tax=Hydromonas duriensis TaxID=1527608 RepID=A0A4R6Y8F1_9BURK|nr:peptide-methionine (S)-S-oxide reductase MsrA [Hydromonas duriensis]TDR31667.1 peptide-methionine (S)-S-oxide reductase [Hydromonas duriensis]
MVIPNPQLDESLSKTPHIQKAVFAGGCFWGVQAVFQHVKGVTLVVSGYSGGKANQADYSSVSSGTSGHAESVEITYDTSIITYGQLLKVFFSVAHNPTELNRQGPDTGTQYRSGVFYITPEQQRITQAYIQQLQKSRIFKQDIVTQSVPLTHFYAAENYHQNYFKNHPDSAYIIKFDAPKLVDLKQSYPELYLP